MKRLILIIFTLISLSAFSQETTEPVKNKSNRIILHFSDTTGLFIKLSKDLIDRGYDLDTKDREVGIIKTKVRNLPGGWAHSVQVRCLFRDSTVTLSATQPKDFSFDIFYMTRKGSTFYQTWNELLNLANQLKPDRIGYSEAK
jgi:hypothetical protein